ncbi:hypothetical protein VTK73DRAFT_4971 [Phialemonium thermophilum]|uniref:HIT-type domain-containing protein n=1 Tax=Phialemonium thermophilum TaxID=223376 RepID=A0ABR3XXS0_9PEZI
MNNFGVIEVASTKTAHAPGWAYVPDTAINPPVFQTTTQNSRKRSARNQGGLSVSDASARHHAKIRKELELLDRDNQRDVNIPVPLKTGASRAQTKHTPNVRKILQSQKTFANHLDDFQALLAQAENHPASAAAAAIAAVRASPSPAPSSTAASQVSVPAGARRSGNSKAGSTGAVASSRRAGSTSLRKVSTAAAAAKAKVVKVEDADVEMTDAGKPTAEDSVTEAMKQDPSSGQGAGQDEATGDLTKTASAAAAPARPTSYPSDGTILPAYHKAPPQPHPGDDDPLLVSRVPRFPTDEELRALMTAPPLSYLEARATWDDPAVAGTGKVTGGGMAGFVQRYPDRQFCEVCGYWGLVRCTRCGARVCALDCLDVHREECLTRYGL